MKKIQIAVEAGLSVMARLVAIAESLGMKTEEAAVFSLFRRYNIPWRRRASPIPMLRDKMLNLVNFP